MRRRAALSSVLVRVLRRAASVALVAALSTAASAVAEPPRATGLQLEWQAPAGCLDREHARAAIEAALSEPSARAARAVARVRIAQQPDGRWNADIWMYGTQGSGERSFAGASCAHVAEAAALIVAMALDRSGASERGPLAAAEPAGGATPTRFFAGVRAAGDVGSLPAASAGAGLALGVEHGALYAELAGTAWLPRFARGAAPARVGGQFGLFTLGVRGCLDVLPRGTLLQLGPCLGGEAGVATGRGVDISDPETNEHLWAAGLAGLSLRLAGQPRVHLALLAEAGLPLRRPTWEITEFAEVFRASPVLGRAALTLAWLFP